KVEKKLMNDKWGLVVVDRVKGSWKVERIGFNKYILKMKAISEIPMRTFSKVGTPAVDYDKEHNQSKNEGQSRFVIASVVFKKHEGSISATQSNKQSHDLKTYALNEIFVCITYAEQNKEKIFKWFNGEKNNEKQMAKLDSPMPNENL
ncbi:20841_t:CDS:2, partial [Gigaspora rosea]